MFVGRLRDDLDLVRKEGFEALLNCIHEADIIQASRRPDGIELDCYIDVGCGRIVSPRRGPEQGRAHNAQPLKLGAVRIQLADDGVSNDPFEELT